MYRVSSKYVAIITHGKPAHRVKGFTAYLNLYYENTFNITHMKLGIYIYIAFRTIKFGRANKYSSC